MLYLGFEIGTNDVVDVVSDNAVYDISFYNKIFVIANNNKFQNNLIEIYDFEETSPNTIENEGESTKNSIILKNFRTITIPIDQDELITHIHIDKIQFRLNPDRTPINCSGFNQFIGIYTSKNRLFTYDLTKNRFLNHGTKGVQQLGESKVDQVYKYIFYDQKTKDVSDGNFLSKSYFIVLEGKAFIYSYEYLFTAWSNLAHDNKWARYANISKDQKYLVSCGNDASVNIFDYATKKLLKN